MLDLLT